MTEPQPPDVRVGDTERRAVDARLHAAVGDGVLTLTEYDERAGALWAARTRGQLDALVADLPVPSSTTPSVPVPSTARVHRTVAVMSEERLRGPVAPGEAVSGVAVMGSAHLDLAREDLPATVSVRAVAVMGDVQVLVPAGTEVRLTGVSVMGDRKVDLPPAVSGAPVVHLHAVAVMGSVSVRAGDVPAGVSASVSSAPVGHGLLHGAPARRGRRRLGGRRLVVLGVAAAIGLGALSNGGGGGGSGDDTIRVPAGGSYVLSADAGDVTLVVPDGVLVDRSGLLSDDVECHDACRASSEEPVVLRLSGGAADDDVEIESESEHD